MLVTYDIEVTHDPLTESQQAILDAGEEVFLHSWHNVAAGYGADVWSLVRRGLLVPTRQHVGTDQFANYTVYAPAALAEQKTPA